MNPKLPGLEDLHQEFADFRPLLILAPSTRCGSTLLQRAINQGGSAMIYGENFVFLENLPFVVSGLAEAIPEKIRATRAVLDAFLSGERDLDGSALFPDYGAYRKLLWRFLFDLSRFYRDESRRHGYERWGLKHQIAHLGGFHSFLQLVRDYRAITLYRDVVPVAKSMAARWPQNLQTEQQCLDIGKRWQENLKYLMRLDRGRNLVVRYEDLDAGGAALRGQIEAHLDVKLAPEVFAKRVNAHTFDPATGKSGQIYRAPAQLPRAKIEAVIRGAEPLYSSLGYRAPELTA